MSSSAHLIYDTDKSKSRKVSKSVHVVDTKIPYGSSGFVYMLSSCRDFNNCFIGETANLQNRLRHHNSSHTWGSEHRPYFVVAYITYLHQSHEFSRDERLIVTQRWINSCSNMVTSNSENHNLQGYISQGFQLVNNSNSTNTDPDHHLQFHCTIPFSSGGHGSD